MNNNFKPFDIGPLTVGLFLPLIGVGTNLLSIVTPGYFSHDEIEWGLRAARSSLSSIQWQSFGDLWHFHYRPLTFNIWLFLSYFLFDEPQLFHLAIGLLAVFNAYLIYGLVFNVLESQSLGFLSSITFLLWPPSSFVHGWVAAIADILWLTAVLCAAYLLVADYRLENREGSNAGSLFSWLRQFLLSSFFLLALCAKETAIVFPAFILGILVFFARWRGGYRAFVVTSLIAIGYLWLRFDGLFLSERTSDAYTVGVKHVIPNALRYFFYPFVLGNVELHNLSLHFSWTLVVAALVHLLIAGLAAEFKPRLFIAYFYFYYLFMLPTMIIPASFPQYMYGTSLAVLGMVVTLWQRGGQLPRLVVGVVLASFLLHSLNIQYNFLEVGRIQTNLYATLYSIIKSHDATGARRPVVIVAEPGSKSWILLRALHQVPRIKDLPIDGRITVVETVANIPAEAMRLVFHKENYLTEQ